MLQNYTMWKVASVFFLDPTKEQYLKQISKDLKVAHTSVMKNLNELVKLSIIKKNIQKKGKRIFPVYTANIDNINYRKMKIFFNLFNLQQSGMIEYLKDTLTPNTIVVFGSYQRGEDTKDSDIDVFVECKNQKIGLAKFEKKLNRKIQLHFKENFRLYSKELKNNIINGTVLSGFLEGYS